MESTTEAGQVAGKLLACHGLRADPGLTAASDKRVFKLHGNTFRFAGGGSAVSFPERVRVFILFQCGVQSK
jgi:hypothetical protein